MQQDVPRGNDDRHTGSITCSPTARWCRATRRSSAATQSTRFRQGVPSADQYVVDLASMRRRAHITRRRIRHADGLHPRYRGHQRTRDPGSDPGGRTRSRASSTPIRARRLAETNRGSSPLFLSFESSTDEMRSATTFRHVADRGDRRGSRPRRRSSSARWRDLRRRWSPGRRRRRPPRCAPR